MSSFEYINNKVHYRTLIIYLNYVTVAQWKNAFNLIKSKWNSVVFETLHINCSPYFVKTKDEDNFFTMKKQL